MPLTNFHKLEIYYASIAVEKRCMCFVLQEKLCKYKPNARDVVAARLYLIILYMEILPLERVANGEMPCKAVSERVEVEISALAGLVGSMQP